MRRQMRRFILTSAVLGLMAGAAAQARADLTTFTAEGTFQDGATLGGTLTIDTSIGTVTAANLTVGGSYMLTLATIQSQAEVSTGVYLVEVGETAIGLPQLALGIPVSSLVAYAGGDLLSQSTGLTHHNSESGLAGKPCLLVKSKLLDHILATFR
jgi:hypothetical protein